MLTRDLIPNLLIESQVTEPLYHDTTLSMKEHSFYLYYS